MANEPTSAWTPDWAVAPGEILLEILEDRGLTQSELARRLDRPLKTVNEIIKAKAAITPETALQLERTLGITARFWNNLETNFREALARQGAEKELAKEGTWARRFPLTELVRHRQIDRGSRPAQTVDAVLRFFGVSNRVAWQNRWLQPQASFRASPAFKPKPEAVATWLRWGEVETAHIECAPFDESGLRALIPEIRSLTIVAPVSHAVDRLKDLCRGVGVAVTLIPELPGAPLSGAARWLAPDCALIQLSLRHKRDADFWFTFFHEIDHVLTPSGRQDIVDTVDVPTDLDEEEAHANAFARNVLIPPSAYEQFLAKADFSATSIRNFARTLGIAPGIVVGRLQYDGHIPPSSLNSLKRSMGWAKPPVPRR
jgi:HTH-type transcriptional regulator/antitoxin HigA